MQFWGFTMGCQMLWFLLQAPESCIAIFLFDISLLYPTVGYYG
jgi:hypothetical protein